MRAPLREMRLVVLLAGDPGRVRGARAEYGDDGGTGTASDHGQPLNTTSGHAEQRM